MDIIFSKKNYCIIVNGCEKRLTQLETLLFDLFFNHKGWVFSCDQIKKAGWNHTQVSDSSVRVAIFNINKAIGEKRIKNRRNLGYSFMDKEKNILLKPCPECKGSGIINSITEHIHEECDKCNGKGQVVNNAIEIVQEFLPKEKALQ